MRIRPTAMGIEVAPTCKSAMNFVTEGATYPKATPSPMASNIHGVRNLSTAESFLTV